MSTNKKTQMAWWHTSLDLVANLLKTSVADGLTSDEAAKRLKKYGYNQLPEPQKTSSIFLFLQQFASFIVLTLIAAIIISGFFGQWVDAIAIGTIVLFNGIFGFIQEYSAEKSIEALRKMTKPTSRVIRNGNEQTISSEKLVPGDLVLLESGDKIPADGRIIKTTQLATQEAALTGESTPVTKMTDSLPEKIATADKTNMAFMGTIVVRGKGKMLVTQTGLETELGRIATMIQKEKKKKTPLEKQLTQLGHRLLLICFAIVGVIFILGLLRKTPLIEMFFVSISLAVAAIPEGLPAVMTIALALGVQRMARRNALMRRLTSVETLGSVSVICSDKTGTLTKNEMTVRQIWINNTFVTISGIGYVPKGTFLIENTQIDPENNGELIKALKISVLCNGAQLEKVNGEWAIIGDPTEGALLTAAAKAGLEKKELEKRIPLLEEIPFDSERKRMSMIRIDEKGKRVLFSKGAPDVILARSTSLLLNGKLTQLTQEYKDRIMAANDKLAQKALRVLALAYKEVTQKAKLDESEEKDLVFVGLIAMIDPPRPEAKKAIAVCKRAGIRSIMITGDQKKTALAIAKELGIMEGNKHVVTGLEMEKISDKELKNRILDIAVYARVSVKHKLRIIHAWKSLGNIVAMTGDGVNDAPAIKAADIGVAMGITGTEVTKEASDMIITDDNFASIVSAVEEGRGIYDNIVKFVNYLVSSNIAELMIIFAGTLFGFIDPAGNPYVPLLPIHLLWLNLLTDGFPALALGVDPLDPQAMERPPRKPNKPILSLRFTLQLTAISTILALGTITACHYGLQTNAILGHTMTLTTLVILEFVRVEMVRAEYHIGLLANPWLVLALGGSFLLQIAIIYVPWLQPIFKTTALGIVDWSIVIVITLSVWVASKFVYLLFSRSKS